MIVEEMQETPMHFHWSKMEDIINRGGGNLVMERYVSDDKEAFSDAEFDIKIDGVKHHLKPNSKVILTPGESICLEQGIYHRFYGEPGKGKVLVGEVSAVNDDATDNRFFEHFGRFPEIEEDVAPIHLLAPDYQRFI
jgi:D-lyxose ketol-isomerase